MYKIAICDDDKNYREKIEKVIETEGILPKSEIRFYEYESGKELLKNADILHDLVFMDMRMPGLDGNKSVLKLREYNRAAILVFCSGYFEPTSDSINIGQPFRYIMKDLHDRSLKREIPAILSKVKLHCGDSSVTVTSAGRVIRIYTEDILYICLAKRGCSIYVARQGEIDEMHCKESLGDLYERLAGRGFEYAHNSYIVNLAKVEGLEKNVALLQMGIQLNVSRSRKGQFLEDGTQEVLRDVAEYPIYISTKCEEIRSKWSDKYYNTETWPMFDIGVTEDKEKTTLHLSFDFLIADWASIWTLLIEFETIYYNKGNGDEKCAISFRNYVLNEMGMKNSSRYRRDKEYWKNRLDIIPEAPVLPMRSNAEKSNKFIRMARKLSAEDWEKIKFFSSQNSVTPTATVLSIFALCIERWSVNKKFSLNLTTLIRNNKYTGIYNTIGDFTSVDVLEIDLSEKIIFADFVKNVNKQIFEDLDHSSYSGIEVIRDLRKRRKNPMLFFPIIFTSSIGLIKNDGMVGKVNNNGISQTPQAFLDCQVMDNEEGLFINWDIRNGIFEEGVIQDIFCTFLTYLKKISESVEFWNQQANVELPEKQMDQRKNVNSTFKEIKMDTLQNLFLKSALEMPKKTAVVDECGEHTYEELLWTAYGIADELQKCSCKAGDYVGIKLNKSFFQIASVLGTLLIGAAFVPIDNDQPEIRADKILEIAKIKCLIGEKEETHKYREKYKWIDKDSVILKKSYDEIVNDNFDDVAYVIFTSGSTGEPKGVVIEQQAVVNTIIDINERFQVKDKDSILALSQLHFDLSVYDIFGMLATGGTIVIPEKVRYKDPSYWLMLVEKWNITVWNSVPAFMEMFVDYLERFYKGEKLSINKILLSGDWIPVKLPEKICRFLKDVRIYSLGGATEASIWSIYHECKMGESYNSSIPYGVPLSNQGFEVLDANMKPCPDMVQGELYITGKGLAKEYLGDVSKTQSSFFWLNNKRIYKTGDFGRYLRNGEIEFLGRKDSQIKISGHRIDTGEIENAIMDCCSGKNCCVTTVDWNNEPKLVAVIVPKEDEKKDEKSVREALKRYLPQYMIPFFLQFIDEIPCTSNGKVDRQAIRKLFIDKRDDKIQHKRWELENLIDKEIYSILISVLKVDALYPDDNLFELGADSLLMAQIAGRVKEIIEQTKTSVTFDEILRQILNNPTGEAITTFVKSKQNILTSENVRTDDFRIIEKTAKDTVYIFFHTALGTTNCYRFVEKELRKEDLGDFLFINVEDVEWYYSIQYHELVDRITDEYVRKIEQLHYKNINLIGYCLGGILALNVAVKLLEKGIEVNNLFVIDSYPVSGKVEDEFIDEVIFLPMDTFGYTEQLEKMYRNKSTENEKTIFWFGIELVNGNDVEKKLMSFEYACNWNSLSGYVCALVAEWCLNDEISKGKAYNLDEIEGIQKFIESLPGEIKQNIVKL